MQHKKTPAAFYYEVWSEQCTVLIIGLERMCHFSFCVLLYYVKAKCHKVNFKIDLGFSK